MKILFTILIIIMVTVFNIYSDQIPSNIIKYVEQSLPAELKFRSYGDYSRICKQGPFGKIKHIHLLVHKTKANNFYINDECDGVVIFIPATYKIKYEDVQKEFRNAYVTDAFKYKIFLLPYDKDFAPWYVFKTNLIEKAQSIINKTVP